MNVYVHTDDGYPADHRDRVLANLRAKHPDARVQRLDAGKADRILCFAVGEIPDYVRWFLKTGTPTVHYRPDTPPDVYDERLFEATLRAELDAVEVDHDTRMRHAARGGFDQRRNTSAVFAPASGAAFDAVAASRAWQEEQKAAQASEPEWEQGDLFSEAA